MSKKEIWINPLGGLGDTLMLSGVLKQLYDADPTTSFNMVRRTKYLSAFEGHPAIAHIGFPPQDAEIIAGEYWMEEPLGGGTQRAYQILARKFGLNMPANEILYMPPTVAPNTQLMDNIPWQSQNIIIATASDSPRKMMHPLNWHIIVDKLMHSDRLFMQVGKANELHIKGCYSLLGLTSPRDARDIVEKSDLVITVDNYIMHLAHMLNKPAIVLWGPTECQTYGYPEHTHFSAPLDQCPDKNACLGPQFSDNYAQPCPYGPEHCMNKVNLDLIIHTAREML